MIFGKMSKRWCSELFRYDRFKELLDEYGISRAHIGRKLGRDQFFIRDQISRNNDFTDEQVWIIADALRTTPAYLRGESDDPRQPADNSDLLEELQILRDRPDIRMMLHVNKRMTPEQVQSMANMMLSMQPKENNDAD